MNLIVQIKLEYLKNKLSKSLLLLLLALTPFDNGIAQSQCQHLFTFVSEETKNQIRLIENLFNVGRTLSDYNLRFRFKSGVFSLLKKIKSLVAGSIWIDMGAGAAKAMIEGLNENQGIIGLAVSYKKPPHFEYDANQAGRMHYLDGDYVEKMFAKGLLKNFINRVSLITDIVGPLSYSKNLNHLLKIYLELLKTDGELFFSIVSERRYELYTNDQGQTRYRILPSNKSVNRFERNDISGGSFEFKLIEWLKTIKGIEVEEFESYEVDNGYTDEQRIVTEVSINFRVKKISDKIEFPFKLIPKEYLAGDPPVRTYVILPN